MHMASPKRRWTIEEMYSLPDDGNKYELIRGQLFVTPAPSDSHETIGARLNRLLDRYVEANGLGLVYHPRAVVRIDEDTEVEPDLMVRQPQDRPDASWVGAPLPILIVEIASPTTRRRDRLYKRSIYTEAGIPEYWMVDGDERTVCVARPGQADVIARDTLRWAPAGVAQPLVISLADVFGPVHRPDRDA
jgi:Uma2 family endonuclease